VARNRDNKGKQQVAKASGRSVEMAVQRALAELDFAPGELTEDQYEVTIIIPPEEGFMGVGAVDAVVEVTLADEVFELYGLEDDSMPEELLRHDYDDYEEEAPVEEGPDAAKLRAFLRRVLWGLGLRAQIKITDSEEELAAEIIGEDLGIFIGKRGQTLDAVEYLASIAVFPGIHSRKYVSLDAEGYKERRRHQVEKTAVIKAKEAVRKGRPVQLEAMTSAERKIVHLLLRGRDDVTTASIGREPHRAVVITPNL